MVVPFHFATERGNEARPDHAAEGSGCSASIIRKPLYGSELGPGVIVVRKPAHIAEMPPSSLSSAPVMNLLSSDAR